MSSSLRLQLCIRILLLALAYFIAGRLALLLAIPPGFATAVFPPLGIGLAALLLWGNRLVFGVFLGSLALNTNISLLGGASLSPGVVMVAGEIALGSCLAAWAGASMIRRFIGFPNDLTDEWSIFLFFLLGGPIASSVSATFGVGTLCLNGIIPVTSILYSWVTWWTGDTLGVLIATPFVFIFYAKPRVLWRNRFTGVGIPLLVSCVLIVAIFFSTSNSEQQKIQRAFQINAQVLIDRVFSAFDSHLNALVPLKGLFVSSEYVTAEEFRLFTSTLMFAQSGMSALAWDQRVTAQERDTYIAQMRAQDFTQFRIEERDAQNNVIESPSRNEHVVVTYVEPFAHYGKAQGYDITTEPVRQQALAYANRTGAAAMTAPLKIIQDPSNNLSYLIFMPVYKTLDVPKTPLLRQELLRGYVAAIITVSQQIERVQKALASDDFAVSFLDVTDKSHPIEIYNDDKSEKTNYTSAYIWEVEKSVGGRELLIRVVPTAAFVDHNRGSQSWYVLVGGLLFCSLLGGFLLLITGRAQHIALLVEQRTLELNAILSEAVEAIIIINSQGLVERANPAACNLLFMSQEQIVGAKAENIIPVLSELSVSRPRDNNYKSDDKSDNCIWKSRETIALRRDGSHIAIELGMSSVNLPDRVIYTCMIHDITARKKVDRLKSEFISTVSHELRTPLTSITGVLGLLVGGAVPQVPNKALDLLIIAKHNAERLGRLVNDILDIEKLEFGKLQLNSIDCDVNDLIQQAIEQNSGYAIKYGVHLALDNAHISSRHLLVNVDVHRFLQVMANLISNAVKFSRLGGIVTVSAKQDGERITFSVEDQGAGIPEIFRSKIFQKFAQADSSDTRKRDGTGLGLSISRVIVERMGGEINYTTELNKGTVFYFWVPLVAKRFDPVEEL